jgi:PAS domain S-box-containing protein
MAMETVFRPPKIDNGPGYGAYEWRVAEGRMIWSNDLVRLYDLDKAPQMEKEFRDRIHPDDRTRIDAELQRVLDACDDYDVEFRIVRPDGSLRHIQNRGSVERTLDGEAEIVRGVHVDVTDFRDGSSGLTAQRLHARISSPN